jgi:phosphoribosylglycinamide formyltransferase 1
MNPEFRIAIFASGGGTNAEEIIKYFDGDLHVSVSVVLTNNPNAFVLERAKKFNIPTRVFTREEYASGTIVSYLQEHHITHIVLAGFLWLIPESLVKAYPDRIINIHPALLPKFGGKGMYGMKVHESVRSMNEIETGITIHLVNDMYDEGKVLYQAKCEVLSTDTPQQIAHKVHQLEYACYPKVIEKWIFNDLGNTKF